MSSGTRSRDVPGRARLGASGPCSILLVENSRDDVTLVLHALSQQELGEGVVVVADGEAAVDFLFGEDGASNRGALRLVLLDLKLPKLNGLEVLRRIKADPETSMIPVVMLTSSGEAVDRAACYSLGANSYLVKPIGFEDFTGMLGQAVRYWLHLNAVPPRPGERRPGAVPPLA